MNNPPVCLLGQAASPVPDASEARMETRSVFASFARQGVAAEGLTCFLMTTTTQVLIGEGLWK